MKKILLILTGGTIGSRIDDYGNISPTSEPLLINLCRSSVKDIAEFEVIEPFSVLSENMSLANRCCLINTILGYSTKDLDGIIVAHGSDTLCYTASLCGVALRHLDIPLVFIASDLVLSNPDSNGRDNFLSAVQLICDGGIKRGSFICYKNLFGENSVYLSTRLCAADPIFDSFVPFDGKPFGKIKDGKFIYNPHPRNPTVEEVNKPRKEIIKEKINLSDNVILIHSSPALDPNRINLKNISAVINYGYHCGTLDSTRFIDFAMRAQKQGVDIFLASFKDALSPIYESLEKVLQLSNVKRLYNISPESAAGKVLLAYNINPSLVNENLYFEEI